MTEKGKRWAVQKFTDKVNTKAYRMIEDEAEFWIREFCKELEERTRENNKNPEGYSKMIAIGFIYQDLKDEFLGTKPL